MMATPVANIFITAIVSLKECLVGNVHASHRIRIKIVVNMETVDIVACHNVTHHLTDEVAVLLDGRIQQHQTVVFEATLRIAVDDMTTDRAMCRLGLGTIGINPSMQFHIALMALFNHPFQRVPVGLRCPTLLSCQIVAPRLQLTLVEGIAFGTHLENDGIATIFFQLIQLITQRLLHILGRHALELSVDTLYPRTAELALLLCLYG